MEKRLYRSRDDRMIWGVCGGLGRYLDVDPTIIRVITVLLVFVGGFVILAYIILAIFMPLEPPLATTIREEDKKEPAAASHAEMGSNVAAGASRVETPSTPAYRGRSLVGILLIVVGIVLIMAMFNLFWWFRWGLIWPLIIVAIGLLIIASARR